LKEEKEGANECFCKGILFSDKCTCLSVELRIGYRRKDIKERK